MIVPTMNSRGANAIALERNLSRSDVVEVWSADVEGIGRCAVKFPAARWLTHRGAARLIERESDYLERVAHAGVVEVIALSAMRTGPCLIMEYLPGGDLVALAGSHPRHWLSAIRDVVRALAHVHASGVVHGDVKPRNVLLDAAGHAKLIDFGLALETGRKKRAGGGTPAYQCSARRRGAEADPTDDIHALAVMAYEMLCGRLPFGVEPDSDSSDTPPVSPLEIRPIYAHEAALVELAALVETLLMAADAGAKPSLGALDARLGAIIATQE